MGKRIAVLGGTFNPPHMGHMEMAACVYATGRFDQILWMPSGDPPHKMDEHIAEKKHRLQMCRLAVQDFPQYEVSEFELFRNGKTYSFDTFNALSRTNPENDYTLIIGADSLMYITQWYKAEALLQICPLVVLNRPGFDQDIIHGEIERLKGFYGAAIDYQVMTDRPESSTAIRGLCRDGQPIDGLVPQAVALYIREYGLYRKLQPPDEAYIEKLKAKAEAYHSSKRFPHTLGVLKTAINLAQRHHVDMTQAAVGALLHDCAKCIPSADKLKLCEDYHIEVSEIEQASPDLLHSKLGAYLAERDFDIHDREILDAIRYHTTGQPNMSLLEKIVYISDYIEPSRNKAPRLDVIRKAANQDLDKALLMILEDTLSYLEHHKGHIDPKTRETYEFYRRSLEA